jgi:DNA modification methylase
MDFRDQVLFGDALTQLRQLPDGCVQTCVTSPPFFRQRNYGHPDQIGMEPSVNEFVEKLDAVFSEVRRVLRATGTLWINIADTYRDKHRLRVPFRLDEALANSGWVPRADIIYSKLNPYLENAPDRPDRAHEYLFMYSRQRRYYYAADAVREPRGRMRTQPGVRTFKRHDLDGTVRWARGRISLAPDRRLNTVWTMASVNGVSSHSSRFPAELARRCILLGSRVGDLVLDPFAGSGTTLMVARRVERQYLGIELDRDRCGPEIQKKLRLADQRVVELAAFRRLATMGRGA